MTYLATIAKVLLLYNYYVQLNQYLIFIFTVDMSLQQRMVGRKDKQIYYNHSKNREITR